MTREWRLISAFNCSYLSINTVIHYSSLHFASIELSSVTVRAQKYINPVKPQKQSVAKHEYVRLKISTRTFMYEELLWMFEWDFHTNTTVNMNTTSG